jgi:hypothetical protein
LYSTDEHSGVTPIPSEGIYGSIFGHALAAEKAAQHHCIRKFINAITKWTKYLLDFMSITATAIHSTIIFLISSASLEKTIFPITVVKGQLRKCGPKWITLEPLRLSGIIQKRRANSPKKTTQPLWGNALSGRNTNAPFVGEYSSHGLHQQQNSVMPTASQGRKEQIRQTTTKNNASFAETHSGLSNTSTEIPKLAPVSVVESYAVGRSDVYNLTVMDCPEYFANGILVHNCARNGIVGAYASTISEAKPVKMGNFSTTEELRNEGQIVDIEQVIQESIENDQRFV